MAKEDKVEKPVETKIPASAGPGKIKKGAMVIYWKVVQTNTGDKTDSFPAIILKKADTASNFKEKDGAVDLLVFTNAKGGTSETRYGVMFSAEKQPGRWTWEE